MRDGSLSYARFCAEAKLLEKRSHEVARAHAVGSGRCVATWEWRHGNRPHLDGNSYLVSTGNARRYRSDASAHSERIGAEPDCDIDALLLVEDEGATGDEDVFTPIKSDLHPEVDDVAVFELHILYHTIYQTPVLYFRVSAVDGTPLPASSAVHDVRLPGSNGHSALVALEEHPVLGKPYAFLHPCETAAAMQLLQSQHPSSPIAGAPSASAMPNYLASWLSLVQPLTGISPLDYYSV